jgi:glucose/arabinose dehydrogenase
MRTKLYHLLLLQIFFLSVYAQPVIKLQQVKTGFALPVCIDFMQDYMYVTEQDGIIRVVDPMNNTLSAPFLDITGLVHNEGERGLLGFAFHPDYVNNGYFYVNYSRIGDFATVLARYSRSGGDPFQADPNSAMILHVIAQPFTNHNGGDIKFGPDGMLYISSGDGGSGGDPQNNSQTLTAGNKLGKILRYNVSDGTTFTIPADNPFFGQGALEQSIWAYGLRNPWKFNFGASGLWIADVGQSALEEINLQPATAPGVNYGWRCYEGTAPFNTAGCTPPSNYTFPVYEYSHALGNSITGGYQYAGTEYPLLSGYYVCADYITGRFFTVHDDEGTWVGAPNEDHANFQFATFGQDALGNMYVAGRGNGIIYKVVEFCSDYIPTAVFDEGELTIEYFGDAIPGDVSVQWYLDGNLIPGANSQTYVPVVDGDYSVEVSHNIEDCVITSEELFVDVTILDLNIKDWNVKCENSTVYSDLSWYADDKLEQIIVQVSSDNRHWINVQELQTQPEQQNWNIEFPGSGDAYIRVMSKDVSGELSYSSVKFLNCPLDGISIFPSPAKQAFTISSLNLIREVELFDINGKVVQSWRFNNDRMELTLNNHPYGLYIVKAKMENGSLHQTKLMIGD